jgi:hypothetical protein
MARLLKRTVVESDPLEQKIINAITTHGAKIRLGPADTFLGYAAELVDDLGSTLGSLVYVPAVPPAEL